MSYKVISRENEIFPDRFPGAFSHFRIPSIAATPSGLIFAFCEGRKSRFDYGDIDILLKVSDDGGVGWRALEDRGKRHRIIVGRRAGSCREGG